MPDHIHGRKRVIRRPYVITGNGELSRHAHTAAPSNEALGVSQRNTNRICADLP